MRDLSMPIAALRGRLVTANTVALMMLSVVASPAHQGDLVYPIYKLAPGSTNLQDGHLLDWEDVTPGASLTPADFQEMTTDPALGPTSPEELAFRVFLGWVEEEQRVYVAVETFDDIYYNEWDGMTIRESWFADHVEFYIDGDHSGGEYSLVRYGRLRRLLGRNLGCMCMFL